MSTGRSSPPPGQKPWLVLAIVATVIGIGAVGGLAYWQGSKCPPGEQKVGNACLAVTPPKSPSSGTSYLGRTGNKGGPTAPERYSSGERRLLLYKANVDGERGTQAFSEGNLRRASDFFAKAVRGDRQDPEVQIYLNNAKARLQGRPFTLATVVPVDSAATSAEEMLRGVADAQTKFNDAGGLGSRLLEVVIANDGNDTNISGGVARKLANNPAILGVVGHNASSASQEALVEYEKAGLAMVSPTSTSTALSGRVFFRTVPSDAVSGKKLAEYGKNQLGLERVAVFYNPNSSYSRSLKEAFVGRFQPLGGDAQIIDMNDADLDVERSIGKLQDDNLDAIVLFPNTSLISVAVAIAVANEQKMLMLGGDALYRPQTLTSGGNAVENLILAVPWFAQTTYAQKAEQRWGGQVSWRTATSYDATRALIQALSANASRETVLDNLQYTFLPGSETSGSELQFQSTGDRVGEPILVKIMKGGSGPVGSQFSFQPITSW